MNKINADTEIEELEITDYPYLGIGKKPFYNKQKFASEEQLEKIIGG